MESLNTCTVSSLILILLESELAEAHPDTGAVFICIHRPTDCVSV